MSDPYDQFEKAFIDAIPVERIDYGTLGFTVNGQYLVVSPENTQLYRVVMEDGTYMEIPHGSCTPVPGLRVEIAYDRFGKPYIKGPDTNWLSENSPNTTGQYNVPVHSHARGSGMEFKIDLRLVSQFYVELQGDLSVFIKPGFYYFNNQIKYWAGDFVYLSSYVPSTSSTYKWIVIAFDPLNETPVVLEGTDLNYLSDSITEENTVNIDVLSLGYIPIIAAQLKNNMSALTDAQIVSLLNVLAQPQYARPIYLYQDTTDQLTGTGAWSAILWDNKRDLDSYLNFGATNDLLVFAAGTWLLEDLRAFYVQASGADGNLALRFYNVTQDLTVAEFGSSTADTNIDHSAFQPTLIPTEFESNGSDEYSLELYASSNEFRKAFPTILKCQKL